MSHIITTEPINAADDDEFDLDDRFDDDLDDELDDTDDSGECGTTAPVTVQQGRPRRARHADERGMATAEYAVGTVAAVALVTGLINVFRNPEFLDMLLQLVMAIFRAVMASKGLGV
ncbi:DUF4244 domain-containing protein [Raineyella fluvialis]|uniref:DUF4244 domain-containing protein n=1 Tax=Raineyella fluvialis TaxID=2662261 RepID=A0A5Q2F756_9ACTN|nr:DUF4244 domain-containing protein [Raineyella fluvialis]QGF22830.1 DUF4244 domain-containing protein [Raineyella fluvialis]